MMSSCSKERKCRTRGYVIKYGKDRVWIAREAFDVRRCRACVG